MASQISANDVTLPAPQRPDVWQNLENVVALAVAGVVVYLAATEDLAWVPFVAGSLIAVFLLLVRWPWGALSGLFLAATVPRWFFKVSGFNVKPEQLVVVACGGVLLGRMLVRKHKWQALDRADFLVLAFLAVNYVSSYFASPDPPQTLRWAFSQTLAVFPVYLIGQVVRSQKGLNLGMVIWLCVGLAEAIFGIVCYGSHMLFGTQLGITAFYNLNFIPGVHGTQWEPNIFGSYCACFAVMFLFYFLADERKKAWYLLGFLVMGVAVLLSLARQAWASTIVAGIPVLVYSLRRRQVSWKTFIPFGVAVLIALIVSVSVMKDLPDRLASLSLSEAQDDPTVIERGQYIVLALDDIKAHPILGLGTASFQLMYLGNDESYQGVSQAWLGSFFFRVLHDTGIIGSILLGWFFVNLGRRAWRVMSTRKPTNTAVGALCAATIVMLVAYQLTDASTLTFTWVHLGLLAAAIRIAEDGITNKSLANGISAR